MKCHVCEREGALEVLTVIRGSFDVRIYACPGVCVSTIVEMQEMGCRLELGYDKSDLIDIRL